MTVTAMQAVKQHIVDSGLDSGYSIVFDSLNDARDKGKRVILIKNSGQGLQRNIANRIDLDVFLIDFEQNIVDATNRINQINQSMLGSRSIPGVAQIYPLNNPVGSIDMDDNRKFWRFTVQVFESYQ